MDPENEFLIKNKYITVKTEALNWALGLGFLSFLIFAVSRYYFGNKIIGSWFERPGEYTTQYWTYLEPDKNSTKNYRVRSDIEKISFGEDGYGYFLRTVYWNNGGNSDFDDCQIESAKGQYCLDIEGTNYYVRLGEKIEE